MKDFSGREIHVGDWLAHGVVVGTQAELRWLLVTGVEWDEVSCLCPRNTSSEGKVIPVRTKLYRPRCSIIVSRTHVPEHIRSTLEHARKHRPPTTSVQ